MKQFRFRLKTRWGRNTGLTFCVSCLAFSLLSFHYGANTQTPPQALKVAVLDFGNASLGRVAAQKFAANLKQDPSLVILDQDQTQAAARGAGYNGSLNLSLNEARDLGAALGCDFYFLGDAQTLRRSPSTGAVYFESYASVFLVSARTGRLHAWERPTHKSDTPAAAEQRLLAELSGSELHGRFEHAAHKAAEAERGERALEFDHLTPVIESAPDDERIAAAEGLRLPRPFKRFVPEYPQTAAQAEVEATVDVLVDLDAAGEVTRVEVARWAGFGLDQATIDNVRRLHFFPAMRNGVAVPLRVLLRYNFRSPMK